MSWRKLLETLHKQFEAQAERSDGLHHLFVEVADDERDRMKGPEWFVQESHVASTDAATLLRGGRWQVVEFSGLPGIHPRFRELKPGETTEGIQGDRIIRDRSGLARAVFEPQRLRESYLCGDQKRLGNFKALAEASSRVLSGVKDLTKHEFANDLADLFREPRGGIRYVFGDVPNPPSQFIARGWQAGTLVYDHGVLVDVPISEDAPTVGHWLLLLHRLSWRHIAGSPLRGDRLAWRANTTVPLDWIVKEKYDAGFPNQWRRQFSQISTTSYYSLLGERDRPLDVSLASAFAIEMLLRGQSKNSPATEGAQDNVDYSKEGWRGRTIPPMTERTIEQCRSICEPHIVLLTATPVERDTVLKNMEPPPGCGELFKVFHDNNTFFVGTFGAFLVVLCMCEMGSSGRDSAQIVANEALQTWKPKAIIQLGIAFGRDRMGQKIGDVLVADRVISYEPCRIGPAQTTTRGHHYSVTPMLLNRFRNAIGWSFLDPLGSPCGMHFGPVLSGEKLVDNSDFKAELFAEYPNALGGEMEGVGLAAAAERSNCEWILVKGICDWADGKKDKRHQEFAAASAVSLVRHVLMQSTAIVK